MPIYRVKYNSMTANYGPSYIEASTPEEAKRKFGGTAFTASERNICMSAKEVSVDEMRRELESSEEV